MSLILLAPVASLLALFVVGVLIIWILRQPEGNERMIEIARYVQQGAYTYIKQQYKIVGIFFFVVFFLLLFLALNGHLVIFVPFAFLSGGFFSGLSGFIGLSVAVRAGSRTANAATKSLNAGLRVAFNAGSVMGLTVVGLGLLDLSIWYFFLDWYYTSHPILIGADKIGAITSTMLCFGMGASSQALFARVGGGIFTKAADVGADLVGKVEAGIPEDDSRNPAVIADNVGDNVGDVAGMGADLYESYVGSIVATMALAVAAGLGVKGVIVPMTMAACGVLASVIGIFCVKTKEAAGQAVLLNALRRAIIITGIITAITSYLVIMATLGRDYFGVYLSVLTGLLTGIFLGLSTEYYTSSRYKPTISIANAAATGPATVVIAGMSVGMLSTAIPVLLVSVGILAAFYLAGGAHSFNLGLYGIGIAGIGMLSTLGITLATDAYGPVADNAGGNAQMSNLDPEVRKRTDSLDALGNTTAATGKGFAIGSAALTALALIVAYKDQVEILGGHFDLSFLNPKLITGMFIGSMLVFLFCSLTMRAVGRAAGKIVIEVRRQFKEIVGLMAGTAKPDYSRCVTIATRAAQKEMVFPSLLAITSPVIVGLLMGLEAEVGLLMGALASGFIVAIMMANSGGAWDNAKKYIEEGNLGGKGSLAHKAAVVGDTIGDPFKDTSGPSLNILIKLMSMVAIVFASVVIKYTLFK